MTKYLYSDKFKFEGDSLRHAWRYVIVSFEIRNPTHEGIMRLTLGDVTVSAN